MANAVQELAANTPGKESLAIEAFAIALRQLPTAIADNAGYDSSELVSQLRALHSKDEATMGLGTLTYWGRGTHVTFSRTNNFFFQKMLIINLLDLYPI